MIAFVAIMVDTLRNLNERIIACRQCPRLVRYREKVAREKRAAYREWNYWGKPVPGFGDARAALVAPRAGQTAKSHGVSVSAWRQPRTWYRPATAVRLLPSEPAEYLHRETDRGDAGKRAARGSSIP